MRRVLCLTVAVCVLTATPPAIAEQQIASTSSARSGLDGAARAGSAVARTNNFSTTIQGNALTSANGFLVDTHVRLRDARYGRVVATQITDKTGLFAFHGIDPGSYIVELVSPDQTAVLAASQILNVNAGEVVSAVVKLPFGSPPFSGVLGANGAAVATGKAAAVVAEAAANGVLIAAAPRNAVATCAMQVF